MNKTTHIFKRITVTLAISLFSVLPLVSLTIQAESLPTFHQQAPSVPEGDDYVEVNDNIPIFTNEELSSLELFVEYGKLDELGRVTPANALLGEELMPAEDRPSISHIFPTGWDQKRYVNVSAGWLYNRSHLIGYQLVGDEADPRNLMTATRWFNVEGMLPFENFVANFIETQNLSVRYRVTPLFEGENLLASGAFMEGFSMEDKGEGLQFHIYIPNIQPGVEINYKNGASLGPIGPLPQEETDFNDGRPEKEKIETPLKRKKKLPIETEKEVADIDTDGNGQVTIKEAKAAGCTMPITFDHWLYPFMIDGDGDGMVGE